MPRYRVLVEYDGAAFSGWQVQARASTIQGELQHALSTCLRTDIGVTGSGRTDTGVHAIGQVAHFDAAADLALDELARSVNGILRHRCSGAAVVLGIARAPTDFHARYDAVRRSYHYRVSGQPRAIERQRMWLLGLEPDWRKMNEAAALLIGEMDFDSFCLTASSTSNRVCTIERAKWVPEARPGDWRFEIIANRFLHGMVRAIVGTLVDVGRGRREPGDLTGIIEARDRRAAGRAAPPHGLTLVSVEYRASAQVRW